MNLSGRVLRRAHVILKRNPCSSNWTTDYLVDKLSGVTRPVHVTPDPDMNFTEKNFKYSSMALGEVVKSCAAMEEGKERFYLRAVSEENPRTKPVRLEEDFPSIASDFTLPDIIPTNKIFSSVLRVSSMPPSSSWLLGSWMGHGTGTKETYIGGGKGILLSAVFLSSATDDADGNEIDEDRDEEENCDDISDNDLSMTTDQEMSVTSTCNYLMTKEEVDDIIVDFIEGDKAGSKWLVMNDIHILHKYGPESKEEIF